MSEWIRENKEKGVEKELEWKWKWKWEFKKKNDAHECMMQLRTSYNFSSSYSTLIVTAHSLIKFAIQHR
jgi:hypothetical protein